MKMYVKTSLPVGRMLLLSYLLVIFLTACNALSTFESYVESGNYADATNIYREKISGNSTEELEAKDFVRQYMQGVLDSYASGQMDNQEVESAFDCLLKIDDELYILNVELGAGIEQLTDLQMSKENFIMATSAMDIGDYEGALNYLASVDEGDTQNYAEAINRMELCKKAIQEKLISTVNEYIATREYEMAINSLEQFSQNYANLVTSEIGEALENCKTALREEEMSIIDQFIVSEEYENAIKSYTQFLQTHGDLVTSDMERKMSDCKEEYRNQVIEKSIGLYHEHGAEAANAEINRGLQLLYDDQPLISVSSLYQSVYEPIPFQTLTGSEKGASLHGMGKTDSFGKNHSDRNLIYFLNLSDYYGKTAYIERNTYGTYSKLTGSMYFVDTNYDMSASMKIYLDGVEVFESGTLNKKTGGVDFDVDISGAYSVKIELSYIDVGNVYSQCFLDNVFVTRILTDEEIYQTARQ